jgi:hypothetical protein
MRSFASTSFDSELTNGRGGAVNALNQGAKSKVPATARPTIRITAPCLFGGNLAQLPSSPCKLPAGLTPPLSSNGSEPLAHQTQEGPESVTDL